MKKAIFFLILSLSFLSVLHSQNNQWTWMKGDNTISNTNFGVYGTLGTGAVTNRPGSRYGAVNWTDASGNMWLLGGSGYAESGSYGYLNDLWKYSPATNQWTWIKGDKTINAYGVYGTQGTAAAANKPGGRSDASTWTDASGNMWLWGGSGYAESGSYGYLNDLWKYNPATNQWTWIKGDKTTIVYGVYGTQGTAAAGNKPGSRYGAVEWTDASGNLWLFGGDGFGESGSLGYLNDLWKYNITSNQWTWMKGDKTRNILGVYGTQGNAAAANKPGARTNSIPWADGSGNIWLFGGFGWGEAVGGYLNDLWKYNIAANQWTWMKGDKTGNITGVYGVQGTAAAANKPGGRSSSNSWIDASGNFWLFGGNGYPESGNSGSLNDLWQYNPSTNQWAWMKGDKIRYSSGVLGSQGVAATANNPGGKNSAVSWKDGSGNLWVLGGNGVFSFMNDMWKYNIGPNQWTWVRDYVTIGYSGVYGNTFNSANKPGSRYNAASWDTDAFGRAWLFGGYGIGSNVSGYLNDLWAYDVATNQWVCSKGDGRINLPGVYGTIGVGSANNTPGGRRGAVTWKDNSGNLWLFGGEGIDESGSTGKLNDLWKYSNNQWTWISGDKVIDVNGVYGVQGTPAAGNKPGARNDATAWFNNGSGNLWLFGGYGLAESGSYGVLNDVWEFDTQTNQWTWVKGDKTINEYGMYADPIPSNNKPGGRSGSVAWIDASNSVWIFGGSGYGESGSYGYLNDLWKWDCRYCYWVLIKGNGYTNELPVYGTQGVMADANTPGGRSYMAGWKDQSDNLWIFSGDGSSANDLWKFDIINNQWIWVKGSPGGTNGTYGTQGVSAVANTPGYRNFGNGWKDGAGNFWLFGGDGYAGNTTEYNVLNDLWKFSPCTGSMTITSSNGSFCNGVASIIFSATGGGGTYEWYKDGTLIPGQTGSSLTTTAAGTYYAKSTVGSCPVYSQSITLLPAMVTPSLGGKGIYSENYSVNVGIPLTEIIQDYSWKQNGAIAYGPIGGNGGNQSLQFAMTSSARGTYVVESTRPSCTSVFSNTVDVYFGGITNLSITGTGSNSISFSWMDYNNPIKRFQYAVTTSPTPPASGTTTTSTSATVGSLSSCTDYYIHVRGADIPNLDISQLSFSNNWTTISFSTPVPSGPLTWTGAVDTDWSNSGNWVCGQAPGSNSEVLIEAGKPRYPLITSNITLKKLTLNAGASMQVQPGKIVTITGL